MGMEEMSGYPALYPGCLRTPGVQALLGCGRIGVGALNTESDLEHRCKLEGTFVSSGLEVLHPLCPGGPS